MKYPAFYRRFGQSKIIKAEYDIESGSLFDLKFKLPFKFAEELVRDVNSLIPLEKDFMLKKFLLSKDTLATIVINGEYVATVKTEGILVEGMTTKEEYGLADNYSFENMRDCSVIPVGFERTDVYSYEILMTPARLYYDQVNKKVLVNNNWVALDFEPSMFKSKAYYKILMNSDAYAIIACDKGYKLLTKEGLVYDRI